MTRATITITRDLPDRARAVRWVNTAPFGTRIDFRAPKRTIDQNDRMWAMLTDVARQLLHHGEKLTTNEWKYLFLDLLGRENRVVPSLDGKGIVSLGMSSSGLSKEEMSDLMECIAEFGARHGVKFGDDE
jgi:hypothetical protein